MFLLTKGIKDEENKKGDLAFRQAQESTQDHFRRLGADNEYDFSGPNLPLPMPANKIIQEAEHFLRPSGDLWEKAKKLDKPTPVKFYFDRMTGLADRDIFLRFVGLDFNFAIYDPKLAKVREMTESEKNEYTGSVTPELIKRHFSNEISRTKPLSQEEVNALLNDYRVGNFPHLTRYISLLLEQFPEVKEEDILNILVGENGTYIKAKDSSRENGFVVFVSRYDDSTPPKESFMHSGVPWEEIVGVENTHHLIEEKFGVDKENLVDLWNRDGRVYFKYTSPENGTRWFSLELETFEITRAVQEEDPIKAQSIVDDELLLERSFTRKIRKRENIWEISEGVSKKLPHDTHIVDAVREDKESPRYYLRTSTYSYGEQQSTDRIYEYEKTTGEIREIAKAKHDNEQFVHFLDIWKKVKELESDDWRWSNDWHGIKRKNEISKALNTARQQHGLVVENFPRQMLYSFDPGVHPKNLKNTTDNAGGKKSD